MTLNFEKYDGAGNDFVLIDLRTDPVELSQEQIARICHRRFGVGADGLMTLSHSDSHDFEMRYYNSDGGLGSMCGNGGRCIAMFAHRLGLSNADGSRPVLRFIGYDGPHEARVLMWDEASAIGLVELGMRDVEGNEVKRCLDGWFLDTGSPHYVQRVADLEHFPVVEEGRRLRYDTEHFPQGTNVDFIEDLPDGTLMVRTYERGVEDETWSCGTGVTACAIVSGNGRIKTRGGDFRVSFDSTGTAFHNVRLTGPVSFNFSGTITI